MQPINLTVKQLNMYVRSLLEGDTNLASITLEGEISGFKNHFGSGHWYFLLKDADASVKSVMFKGNAQRVNFIPSDGMRVVCRVYVSLYEKDGQFQFYAETMQPFGEGDLAAEFERLKRKLESEGLFSLERKRPLPKFPKKIGVITSESGAALQDILQVTSRRYPICDIVVFPALVQGISAPNSLVSALEKAYSRDDLDLIIIGRGGGSAEDLSCFNDELLARKIAVEPIPVISAVGHEVDFTICDFVSDLRAPTPSAAAELAVPWAEELLFNINSSMNKIKFFANRKINNLQMGLDNLISKRCFANPKFIFEPFEVKLKSDIERFETAYLLYIKEKEIKLNKSQSTLDALSPLKVMERGFSVVYSGENIITDINDLNIDDTLKIRLLRGSVTVKVLDKSSEGYYE